MTPVSIILVAATPFVLFYLRQRARFRAQRQRSEIIRSEAKPSAGGTDAIENKSIAPTLDNHSSQFLSPELNVPSEPRHPTEGLSHDKAGSSQWPQTSAPEVSDEPRHPAISELVTPVNGLEKEPGEHLDHDHSVFLLLGDSLLLPAIDQAHDIPTVDMEERTSLPSEISPDQSFYLVDTVPGISSRSSTSDYAQSHNEYDITAVSPEHGPVQQIEEITEVPNDGTSQAAESDESGPQQGSNIFLEDVEEANGVSKSDDDVGDVYSPLGDLGAITPPSLKDHLNSGDQIGSSSSGKSNEDAVPTSQLRRYKPPSQSINRGAITRKLSGNTQRENRSETSIDIRVRLTFDRTGFCTISLLPVRKSGLDDEITVKCDGTLLQLTGQEDWYDDLHMDNISDRLKNGLRLNGMLQNKQLVQWSLLGRDLYVLATHPSASGFVSTSRLLLGRSHIVLCTGELLPQVEVLLRDSGCTEVKQLNESEGAPVNWAVLSNVTPTKSITLLPGDTFYAIKPAPELEIYLEGGIRLQNSVWLAGFPPRIRLLGKTDDNMRTLVDGKVCERNPDGDLVVEGYDQPGQHFVHCEGQTCSRSYSIEDPPATWEAWPAYTFDNAEFCGPLVSLFPTHADQRIVTVPMSNPLLLGAHPGQVFSCPPRRSLNWRGFVPFDVVWALPPQPLLCDKKVSRIIQLQDLASAPFQRLGKTSLAWCNAILQASQKGIQVDSSFPNGVDRWREYKKQARSIRKVLR